MSGWGLYVVTRPERRRVSDPELPSYGNHVSIDHVIGMGLCSKASMYAVDPRNLDTRRRIWFGALRTWRLFTYWRNIYLSEEYQETDCFSLVEYVSAGHLLKVADDRFLPCLERIAPTPITRTVPGRVYVNGKSVRDYVVGVNHAMIGLGGNLVLAKWGMYDASFGIGTLEASMDVYGGRIFEAGG